MAEETTASFGQTQVDSQGDEVHLPSVDQTLKDHKASINGHSPA